MNLEFKKQSETTEKLPETYTEGQFLLTKDGKLYFDNGKEFIQLNSKLNDFEITITADAINELPGNLSSLGTTLDETKMDKENPTGTGSFSLNRKAETTIGDYSFTEGYNNTASGSASHAEGLLTVASSQASHAEGCNTKASNDSSHAEGELSLASGYASHAEGICTVANSLAQHVQGEYNILDDEIPTDLGNYAHIVGNGTADNARSNAHTLDWEGNAWFAGDVYVGSTSGTNKDGGSIKLVREDQINGNLEIDGNGKINVVNTSKTNIKYFVTGITEEEAQIYNPNVYVEANTSTLVATKVKGAVWNDYAEYRESNTLEPGRVVCENGDDTLSLSKERLQPGANVISDTFGFAIGETEKAKTPIAVSGRVLAYPYENRNEYLPGDAVCAGPDGTVSKMSREEIMTYPERIIGTVSAIPTYETWGENNIAVNGRIWIKIK